jgi:hypothetical protein
VTQLIKISILSLKCLDAFAVKILSIVEPINGIIEINALCAMSFV